VGKGVGDFLPPSQDLEMADVCTASSMDRDSLFYQKNFQVCQHESQDLHRT
jgi:hypothetical protein